MWGAVAGAAASLYSAYMASEAQEDTNVANKENAQAQMAFQERMSNTAHQREVNDLIAAGINPMLSAKLGGASTPAGAMSVNQNSGAAAAKAFGETMGATQISATIDNIKAQTAQATTQADLNTAKAADVRETTPTHEVTRESLTQGIAESKERIEHIIQEVKTGKATEENIRQLTTNAQETIAQIRAQVEQLKQHSKLMGTQMPLAGGQTAAAYAQAGLAGAQKAETVQRTVPNLPAIEAALANLERVTKEMGMPKHAADSAHYDSAIGVILNAWEKVARLLPFGSVIANFPKSEKPTGPGRKDWKK